MRATPQQNSTLDPRTLGRPVHLLGKFAALLRHDLAERLRAALNRRYRAHFEISEVAVARLDEAADTHWLSYDSPFGPIGFSLDRALLLCVLDYRYGTAAGTVKDAEHAETTTEERLVEMLGRQFASMLVERLASLAALAGSSDLAAPRRAAPPAGAWTISAQLAERRHDVRGMLRLTVDDGTIERVFRALAPARADSFAAPVPLGAALQLDLRARLLEVQMPLGTLLDARIGDVIPVALGPTAVLVDDAPLFYADVAEHKGQLCLTSFQDVD
ncbi:FliM/FliN family flagellar motor switch protein [Aromatoleum sp.]|uniref:FliM/FliN family flagellar motor switch protein n=1 Tax=Aromatoleum sp. TaxID=2307007 RepID=UPI002FC881F3